MVPAEGIVGDGSSLDVEAPIEIGPCDDATALNQFYYDDSSGMPSTLKLDGYDALCVTFLGGAVATKGAPMVIIPCGNENKYGWDFVLEQELGAQPTSAPSVYLPPLRYQGRDACNVETPCRGCTGDCDTDDDCLGELQCFQRDRGDSTQVPGCAVGGPGDIPGADYCHGPKDGGLPTPPPVASPTKAPSPVPPLSWEGGEGCTVDRPCQACTGDCDEDDDCAGSLTCFKRLVGETTQVPGCAVGGTGDVPGGDYCHDPNWNMPPTDNENTEKEPSPTGRPTRRVGGGSATPSPTEEESSSTSRPTRLQKPPRPGRSSPSSEPVMTPSPTAGKDPRKPIPAGEPVPSNLLPTESMPASPSPPEEPVLSTPNPGREPTHVMPPELFTPRPTIPPEDEPEKPSYPTPGATVPLSPSNPMPSNPAVMPAVSLLDTLMPTPTSPTSPTPGMPPTPSNPMPSEPGVATTTSLRPTLPLSSTTPPDPTAGGETPRNSSSKSSKNSSKSGKDGDTTITVAIGRTRNHDATSNHATNHATTHWERDHPGELDEEYHHGSMDHQGEEDTIEVAAAAIGRTRNHDATSNHATDHASTRWERDHPDQQGDVTVTEERTRDHASTRWEREHPDDEQAE